MTKGTCIYEGCRFNCRSPYHHRARYSYISRNWKKKVAGIEKKVKESGEKSVSWNELKQSGVLYHLPPDENNAEEN